MTDDDTATPVRSEEAAPPDCDARRKDAFDRTIRACERIEAHLADVIELLKPWQIVLLGIVSGVVLLGPPWLVALWRK